MPNDEVIRPPAQEQPPKREIRQPKRAIRAPANQPRLQQVPVNPSLPPKDDPNRAPDFRDVTPEYSPGGEKFGQLTHAPTYWQNPQVIQRWYNKIQTDPSAELPEGMDRATIEGTYNYMKFRNKGTDPGLWKFLNEADPMSEYLRSTPAPANKHLYPDEIKLYGELTPEEQAAQTPGGTSQMDYKAPDFDWTKLTTEQKQTVLKDPNFAISKVIAGGQQGLILSDKQFDLWGKARRGELPWWQPIAYSVMSNPKTSPLLQGAALTVMTKGKGLGLATAMTLLGYGAQSDNPTIRIASETLLKPFMWGAQTAEQLGGTASYLSGGASEQAIQPWQIPLGPVIGGGIALYETGKGITESGRLEKFLNDPNYRRAVWEGSKVFYETQSTEETPLQKLLKQNNDNVWVLGEGQRVPVQPGYTLDDAVGRVVGGESADSVLADFTRAYGFSGVASDFLLQSVYDPLNAAPDVVGEVRARGAEGAAIRAETEAARLAAEGVQPERVTQLNARAQIEGVKAEVFRATPATTGLAMPWGESGREFKALIQSSLPPEYAKYLTSWERKVAGLTPDGKISELIPPQTPGLIRTMVSLQPKTRAKLFLEKYSNSIASLFDWGKMTDASPRELVQVLKATGSMDMPALKEMGAEFMNTPEAYTTIGAVRDVIPTLEKAVSEYEAAGPNRAMFWQVQGILGDDPRKLLNDFLDGDARPDFQRLTEALRSADAPEAKVLLAEIESGNITPEKLTEMFKPFKDGNVAIHPQEFMAKILNTMDEHMKEWGKGYFNLKKDNIIDDSLRLLKGAQSLLLLDLSPSAIVNDFLNERVMMATTGVIGLTPGKVIDAWIKDFGLTPKEAGYGLLGDLPRAEGDVVSQMTRGDGAVSSLADAVNKTRSYLLRPQASSRFNAEHARQMYYSHAKTFWSRNWFEGKGFERMPPALEARLREYGLDPQLVYKNLRGVFNTKQLDLLKTRATNHDVSVFVDDAAKKLNKNPADVSAMLESLGVLDDLRDRLSRADTPAKRRAAFDAIEQKALENHDIRQAQGLRGLLEQYRNRVRTEGPAGVVQTFNEISLDYFDRKVENDRIWDEAFAESEKTQDYGLRQQIKRQAARQNSEAWRRVQSRQAALFTAAIEGLGMDTEFKRAYLAGLAEQHNTLRSYFEYKNKAIEKFFNTDFPDMDARSREWYNLEADLNERFAREQNKVLKVQGDMNTLFAGEMKRVFGDGGGAMAKVWTDSVLKISTDIHQVITAFRDSIKEMTQAERAAAWQQFKPEYRKIWMERLKADMDGAGNLYKWDQFGGDETPTPAGPTPTPPPEGGAPARANPIDEYRAAQQEQQRVTRETITSIWDVAEQYSRMEPGNSSNYNRGYLQDGYALLGALKKAEYSGDPTIKNMQDAAAKLTPERVKEILDRRQAAKEQTIQAENAAREERLAQARAEATARAETRKTPENVTVLQAIKKHGGIDWAALENFGEKNAKGFPPGTFSKTGKNRWALDQMAKLLSDDGYPIDMNRPDDMGGINQTIELIRRARAGDKVYPVGHDFTVEAAAREAEAIAAGQIITEDTAAHDFNPTTWLNDFTDSARSGDLTAMYDKAGELPAELGSTKLASGETYNDYMSRTIDETAARVEKEANEQAVAEELTRAEADVKAQEDAGQIAMTRQLFRAQLESTFDLTPEMADAVTTMTDAHAEAWARVNDADAAEWYRTRLQDVVRGGEGDLQQEAYHGSPYKFDKFTLDHMGEGEGAQAYGWGLYFTDKKAVAEYYRHGISLNRAVDEINFKMNELMKERAQYATPTYGKFSDPRGYELTDEYNRLMTQREQIRKDEIKLGQTYRVEIPDENYLLWDKPLSEQPEAVKAALVNLLPEADAINYETEYYLNQLPENAREIATRMLADDSANLVNGTHDKDWATLQRLAPEVDHNIIHDINTLKDKIGTGSDIYETINSNPKAASLALRDAGISGIKYLDATSRGKGAGSYNYVIFDDSAVQIKETFYQGIEPINRRMSPQEIESYARALVRSGADELRRAVTNEQSKADRVAILDAAHRLNPKLAEEVAAKTSGLYQAGETFAKGGVTFLEDGKAIIRAFEAADVSTVVHEIGHIFRRDLQGDNLATIEAWAGVKDGNWERAHEEKFARAFERYLADGEAPTPQLRTPFEKFKNWLTEIYKSITGSSIDIKLTDEVRAVFDRMLGKEEEKPVKLDVKRVQENLQKVRSGKEPWEMSRAEWEKAVENLRADTVQQDFTRASASGEVSRIGELERLFYGVKDKFKRMFKEQEAAIKKGEQPPYTPEQMQAAYEQLQQRVTYDDIIRKANEEGKQVTLYQSETPVYPPGGYEQATGYIDYSKILLDGWGEEVRPVLDAMKESAGQPRKDVAFSGMDTETQAGLNSWLTDVRSKMAATKHMAKNYAEAQRDFALLDYSRQYGFDKPLSAVVPYEFFGVRSAANWLTRVVDRPAWISQYTRLMNLHNTYQSQLPERMRNKIYIPMPFLPEWAGGGVFVDPTYQLFPFKQFLQPLDAMRRDKATMTNNAQYVLRNWADEGTITQDQADEALRTQSGQTWERALAQAKQDQGENASSGYDYMSMLLSPALYLTLPYYLATGKKAGNAGFPSGQLPVTRFGQGLETAFKGTPLEWAGDIAGNLAKPEKWLRQTKGLSEFGEWGDFYIDRQLANMVAEGTVGEKIAQQAMLERKGDVYDQAVQRVREELMLKVPGMAPLYGAAHGATLDKVIGSALPSLFPGGLLPPGEMEYKGLKQEYSLAWDAYKAGNKKALSNFFDEHPEYQARLALRRDPAERMQQFLKSEIWDGYTALGTTDRKSAAAFMGPDFQDFLDSDPGVEFSTEQLATWSKMLKGMVPATPETQKVLEGQTPQIDYFSPEVTTITDKFFQERKDKYPHYYQLQSAYYALPKSERKAFLMKFPELSGYWKYKDKYYKKYPELKPVLSGTVFKRMDTSSWPPVLLNMVQTAALTGDDLPDGAKQVLARIWEKEGKPYDDLEAWIEGSVYPSLTNEIAQEAAQP